MSSSIFSQLPNNLIMNIINIHHIQEEKEKKIRNDIFSKCMDDINEVPYRYSRTPSELKTIIDGTIYQNGLLCRKIFNKVSDEFWKIYHQSIENGTNYDTGESSDEDDY